MVRLSRQEIEFEHTVFLRFNVVKDDAYEVIVKFFAMNLEIYFFLEI